MKHSEEKSKREHKSKKKSKKSKRSRSHSYSRSSSSHSRVSSSKAKKIKKDKKGDQSKQRDKHKNKDKENSKSKAKGNSQSQDDLMMDSIKNQKNMPNNMLFQNMMPNMGMNMGHPMMQFFPGRGMPMPQMNPMQMQQMMHQPLLAQQFMMQQMARQHFPLQGGGFSDQMMQMGQNEGEANNDKSNNDNKKNTQGSYKNMQVYKKKTDTKITIKKKEISRKALEESVAFPNFGILPITADVLLDLQVSLKLIDPSLYISICKEILLDLENKCRDLKLSTTGKSLSRYIGNLNDILKKQQRDRSKEVKKKKSAERSEEYQQQLNELDLLKHLHKTNDLENTIQLVNFEKFGFDKVISKIQDNKEKDSIYNENLFEEAKKLFLKRQQIEI